VVLLKSDTNVLAFGVFQRILVVSDITRFGGEDAVITTEFAVLAREPMCAALAKDYVTWDDVFSCTALSATLPNCIFQRRPFVPPLFFAPNRFPGPSLAPLARP